MPLIIPKKKNASHLKMKKKCTLMIVNIFMNFTGEPYVLFKFGARQLFV